MTIDRDQRTAKKKKKKKDHNDNNKYFNTFKTVNFGFFLNESCGHKIIKSHAKKKNEKKLGLVMGSVGQSIVTFSVGK